ncbi:AAA family ATPase [candidate division WOR-3 bacterium]|nr:AAA family ATPase [candidate division WOR-3 bacterium]
MQEKILKAMKTPGFYPDQIDKVRMTETHTAWVFLTGKKAYKVKKPVDFGFLDFSTLEKRKEFCEKEVELNQELSDLYLGVQPITLDSEGGPKLGGKEAIEYAVVMKELPQEAMMSEQLTKGSLDYGVIDRLAKDIADFHKKAKTSSEITKEGSLESVRFNWEENFAQTEIVKGITISHQDFDFIKHNIERFLCENETRFRKREEEGRIRYCHGDLHSGNVFVYKNKIHIFDRIEFNLRFACSDTVADLAFMSMDLDFHGVRDLADFLIDRYLDATSDWDMLWFHDFFRCYRAYVRGKVIGFQLAQNPQNPTEIEERARAYFDLAKGYASTLFAEPRLIVFYGLPGTGKTLMSTRTRDRINAHHIRSDVVRREIAGVSFDEHHYAEFGQDLYSAQTSRMVYEKLCERASKYLSRNQSLILDGTFSKFEDRQRLKEVADSLDVNAYFIRCQASDDKIRAWIEGRKRKDLLSDATWEIYSKMKESFEPEADFTHHVLETGRSETEMDADVDKIIHSPE